MTGRDGAGDGNRTRDLSITKRMLYQLSYSGGGELETGIEPATYALQERCATVAPLQLEPRPRRRETCHLPRGGYCEYHPSG